MWTVSEDEKEIEKLSSRRDRNSVVTHRMYSGGKCTGGGGSGDGGVGGGGAPTGGDEGCGGGEQILNRSSNDEFAGSNALSIGGGVLSPGGGDGSWSQAELEPK